MGKLNVKLLIDTTALKIMLPKEPQKLSQTVDHNVENLDR